MMYQLAPEAEQNSKEAGIIIMESLYYTLPISITYQSGQKIKELTATVTHVDEINQLVTISHSHDQLQQLSFNQLHKTARR